MHTLRLGYAFARSSFLIMLAHRLRYLIGVFNYIVYAAVQWYLWGAVFYGRDVVAGWTLREIQTYTLINWIARAAYFSNSDNVLAGRINKGDIVSDLMRPSSLLLQFYGQALGEMLFRALFMALPVAVLIVLLFGLLPPADVQGALLFGLSFMLAFHLFFALNFLTGLCAVFTEKLQGFLWAKFILIQFLSGQLLPYEWFPEPVRSVMNLLPFKGMAYTPMNIYLGRWSDDPQRLWGEVGMQFAWTLILMILCEMGWNAVRRRLSVLGG